MIRHTVETCSDDPATLQERLDELSAGGAEVVSVMWQQRRIHEGDLSDAMDSSGSFVIVTRSAESLHQRRLETAADAMGDPVTAEPRRI